MKNTLLDFENIDWHDAVIQDIYIENLDNSLRKILIKCKIYISNNDRKRTSIQIVFEKIKKSAIIFNSSELIENATAGNINSCYMYSRTYQFSLFGGYIEIMSKKPPKINAI